MTPDPKLVDQEKPQQICVPVANLMQSPGGKRDRQLIYGDMVTTLREKDGWTYVQAMKDSYCGFVATDTLGAPATPTHRVTAPATHAYETADLKSSDLLSLTFGSHVSVVGQTAGFAETPLGFIPVQHLAPSDSLEPDPATVATLFLGTPYLWGGNSRWGIDCSGLVQASLLACGLPCPGDSDLQMTLGEDANLPYERNDLLFWKGHVALVIDADTMIHATAASMSTQLEPISKAIARIKKNGDGHVTAHRRLSISLD